MLDRKLLRDNPQLVKDTLALRGDAFPPLVERFVEIDKLRRELQADGDDLLAKRNAVSHGIQHQIKDWENLSPHYAQLRQAMERFAETACKDAEKLKALLPPNLFLTPSSEMQRFKDALNFTLNQKFVKAHEAILVFLDQFNSQNLGPNAAILAVNKPAIDQFKKSLDEVVIAALQKESCRRNTIADLQSQQKNFIDAYENELKILKLNLQSATDEERDLLLSLPNLPHDSIPVGGEDQAQIVKTVGEPRQFDFTPRNHIELCERLALVNFEAGVRLAGGGFPVMHGAGALLQRALINFMLDLHVVKHGYTELRPPFMVHPRCPEGTGQLPKFGAEMYQVYVEGEPAPAGTSGPHYYLLPTAEVAVANYYRDVIIEAPQLPIKLVAYSPCWRVEGGSYGKEARGLTRLHQFEKVELVRLSDPERSYEDHEEMTREAESVLELLGLAYRRKVLPTGDMAFASAKTYDLEVYCPAEEAWREVSSASNTTDYQSRRANVRMRRERGGKVEFPHLLNASGLALPRLVIALLETYQTAEGNVAVPEALRKYLPSVNVIMPPDGGAPCV